MTDTSRGNVIGTALIVSEDAVATRQLAEAMQELALSVEVCINVSDALDRVNHSKLEVAVIDFSLGNQAALLLEQLRGSASNRTAVAFAITSSSIETMQSVSNGLGSVGEKLLAFACQKVFTNRCSQGSRCSSQRRAASGATLAVLTISVVNDWSHNVQPR